MDIKQYFTEVLPEEKEGCYYCILRFHGKFPQSTLFVKTKKDLLNEVSNWQNSTRKFTRESEILVCLANLDDSKNRNQDTAVSLKTLFIDIDCKGLKSASDDKDFHYNSQEEAIKAIDVFVNTMNLPMPTIISSGYGLHVYWVLDKSIPSTEWKVLANKLKQATVRHELHNDRGLIANSANILRPLGTFNYKDPDNPTPVKLLRQGVTTSPEHMEKSLSHSKDDLFSAVRSSIGMAATNALADGGYNFDFSFDKIVRKGNTDPKEGCAHIQYMINHPDKIKEPYWRAGISIAARCVEGFDAVHFLSKGYKDYSKDEAFTKMENFLKSDTFAYKCSTINDVAPAEAAKFCKDCKNRPKVRSPIFLGKIAPGVEIQDENVTEENAETKEVVTYKIPNNEELPAGYIKGRNNSILKQGLDEDDDPVVVYPHPLYAVKRLDDPGEGQSLWMRLHTKMDGINEFMLPYTTVVSTEECKKTLAARGIIAAQPILQRQIQQYIVDYANMLREKQKLEQLHVQFGWKDDYQKFVVGVKEFDGEDIHYTPPASTMNNLLEYFDKKGSLEEWKDVFNLYNKPENEPQAFSLMSAFGAPLLEFTDTKGVILHLTSADSGAGKSTIQRFINSLYGNPDMGLVHHDTKLSSFHTFGVLRNLPFCIDEVTDMKPEAVSDLAYAITHGRARNRMSASANKLRENKFTWKSILVTTGNSSFYDKLAEHTEFSDGEMMRVFEIRIPSGSSKEQQDDRYNNINKNYGYAGEVYIQEVIKNIDKLKQRIAKKKEEIRKDFGLYSKERFWTDLIAVNLVGGEFAKEIGLHNYDIDKIYNWLRNNINVIRKKTEITRNELLSFIGIFMNEHEGNQLVVRVQEKNGLVGGVIKEPRGKLLIRIEEDLDRVYFPASTFRKWCSEKRVPYSDVMLEVEKTGVLLGTKKKRLGSGHAGSSTAPSVMCHEFDAGLLTLDNN